MIPRILLLAALLLSALTAPAAMAEARPKAGGAVDGCAAHMGAMDDRHAPIDENQACLEDCALCHAMAPAIAVARTLAVTYVTPAPAKLSAVTQWLLEVEPPIPRSVS